jgi:hypothetical protein
MVKSRSRVGVFRHDAVVLRALDGARHVQRKEFDECAQPELRKMQLRAGQRLESAWRRCRARRNSFPTTAAAARGQADTTRAGASMPGTAA